MPRPAAAPRLAGQVATLRRPDWLSEVSALCGGVVVPDTAPPSYAALVDSGLSLVSELADGGHWSDARTQAAHLADYFTEIRRQLHPVAAVAFQGLCDAAQAHDRDDLDEHASFLREIFSQESAQQ